MLLCWQSGVSAHNHPFQSLSQAMHCIMGLSRHTSVICLANFRLSPSVISSISLFFTFFSASICSNCR